MSLALETKRAEMDNADDGGGTGHGTNYRDVDVASKLGGAGRPNGKERGEGGGGSQLAGAIVDSEVREEGKKKKSERAFQNTSLTACSYEVYICRECEARAKFVRVHSSCGWTRRVCTRCRQPWCFLAR